MKSLIAALLLVPTFAFAAPTSATRAAPDPVARHARMEKRLHTMRAIGLAEALDLDAAKALELDAAMQPFDARRQPLHEQLKQAKQTLVRAAEGDAAAVGQVDQAIQQGFDARTQLAQIDRDMFATVSKGMAPQDKAKLAVFLSHFKKELMRGHSGRGGPHGHGGARK